METLACGCDVPESGYGDEEVWIAKAANASKSKQARALHLPSFALYFSPRSGIWIMAWLDTATLTAQHSPSSPDRFL